MSTKRTFVTNLLRTYHLREEICAAQFELLTLPQVEYLCNVGLGPIVFAAYGDELHDSDPDIYSILLGADLTIRVIYKQMAASTVELLESLNHIGITPVMLKGVSTAYEFYSPPHLRLMGDIDILVEHSEAALTIRKLEALGYETADEDWQKYYGKGHHHLPGARNPDTGVTVEVHTSLFEPEGAFPGLPIFQEDFIREQKIEFDYNGVRAARFTAEFQLIYTIAHWALDENWAINLTSINDTIHILRKYESELSWSKLADWIDCAPPIYPNFAALMHYLEDADIIRKSPQIKKVLDNSNVELQPRTLRLLTSLLNSYPFNSPGKTRDGYARWRAHAMWQELTKPNSRDIKIPYKILRTMFRSIHHGKYNPLGLLLSLFRKLVSRLRGG